MNALERAKFDLEMILPYVAFLKKKTEPLGTHEPNKPELCFPGEIGGHDNVVFEAPSTQTVASQIPGDTKHGILTIE